MSLRKTIPARSSTATSGNYQKHKEQLRSDFNKRCGYCDGFDHYSGGWRGFQIDHFAPHSVFPTLKEVYANLVYCCAFCNRSKSNKWVGDDAAKPVTGSEGFIDPCDPAYDTHLNRSGDGRIVWSTELGSYIHEELQLGLLRHQLLWQAETLKQLAERALALQPLVKAEGDQEALVELLESFVEITKGYEDLRAQVIEA